MAMKYKGSGKSAANLITFLLILIALPFVLIGKILSWIFSKK